MHAYERRNKGNNVHSGACILCNLTMFKGGSAGRTKIKILKGVCIACDCRTAVSLLNYKSVIRNSIACSIVTSYLQIVCVSRDYIFLYSYRVSPNHVN